MSELEKLRNKLLELTRAVNTTRGEEKAKLIEEKEIILEKYNQMKKKVREDEER